MIRSRVIRIVFAAGLALAVAAPAAAQSLTSIRGLGYPMLSGDARTDVLGGIGIGLQGLSFSLVDPTTPAAVRRPGAALSAAAVEQGVSMGDASDHSGAARFPLISVLYPIRGLVFSVSYGGYLDQSWAVTREGEETIAGATVGYDEFIQSTGGVGQFQVGVAASLGERLALGGALGIHTGDRQVRFQRRFAGDTDLGPLETFNEVRRVEYSAPLARIGARWDPHDVLRLAASVTWAGTLSADSVEGPAASAEYGLPLQVAGGASAYLLPSLLATVSGRWSGWSSVGGITDNGFATTEGSAGQDTWEVGGGLEWDDPAARRARSYPVRIGVQYRQLPFTFGGDAPTEWFVGAGAGMRLGADADNPLARVDLSVQRGERTAAGNDTIEGLTESAWRFVLSFSIFGN